VAMLLKSPIVLITITFANSLVRTLISLTFN